MNFKRSAFIITLIISCITLLVTCMQKEEHPAKTTNVSKWDSFAGSASCASCHKSIYQTHLNTAHYLTSRPGIAKYIKGSFENGKNKFLFNNGVEIVMEKQDSNFYQAEYINGVRKLNRRFDIVFGSGRKGQSYLNWYNNRLFQLPITYFTAADQWSNSPGYPDRAVFNRPISSRCMECHTTYAFKTSDNKAEAEEFDHNEMSYGIDCEKCHGAAAQHVQFQSQHPEETKAKYIVNPATLGRQQNIDMCALCHGGRLNKSRPSFEFTIGDTLSKFFLIDSFTKVANDIDVHGNQYGLLAASKCFKNSDMTCSSCHNAHVNESGSIALFSQRCMNCHNTEHGIICKMTSKIGNLVKQNCIDCHMPLQSSRAIAVLLQGEATPTPALLRSHYIKVYPEETKKTLPLLKQQ